MSESQRQLYIGDIIQLKIDGSYVSEKDISDAFGDFEILSIDQDGPDFKVQLRTFEPGTYNIDLAGQEISIVVGSTLTDIQRETIFEPEPLAEPIHSFPFGPAIIGVAGIGVISLLLVLLLRLRKKKPKIPTAYDQLTEVIHHTNHETPAGLAALTKAFKVYLSEIGKLEDVSTTDRTIVAMAENLVLAPYRDEAMACLRACDDVHYRQVKESSTFIRSLSDRIIQLAETIHKEAKDVTS